MKKLVLVLVVLAPFLAFLRILPVRWLAKDKAVPSALYNGESRRILSNATPNGTLCLVGPDETRCEYFYFLHKKGFSFAQRDQLFQRDSTGIPKIESDIRQGARYIYTNDCVLTQNQDFRS